MIVSVLTLQLAGYLSRVCPTCPMALWHLGQASAPVLWMDAFEIPGKYSKLLLNNKLLLFVPNLAVTQMAN